MKMVLESTGPFKGSSKKIKEGSREDVELQVEIETESPQYSHISLKLPFNGSVIPSSLLITLSTLLQKPSFLEMCLRLNNLSYFLSTIYRNIQGLLLLGDHLSCFV